MFEPARHWHAVVMKIVIIRPSAHDVRLIMVIRVLCVLHCICTSIFMWYLAFFSHADKKCSKIMLLQFLKCLTALAWRILRISCYLLAGCIYVTTKDDHSPDCLNKTSILNHIGIVFRLWLSKRAGREKRWLEVLSRSDRMTIAHFLPSSF